MKKIAKAAHSRWRRTSKVVKWTVVILLLLLISARIAAPSAIERYVNNKLDELPQYDGRIGDVDLHLFRGAYVINGVNIVKTEGKVPVPFVAADRVDFSMEWDELFHGSLVGEVIVDRADLNFVKGPTREESQTGVDRSWIKVVQDLFPFKINRFEIRHGAVFFKDFHSKPQVDVYITNMYALATNLTNTRDIQTNLPAAFKIQGQTIGGGDVKLNIGMNPLADDPTFLMSLAVRNLNLPALNDFLEAYANLDVQKGNFELFSELAAADGKVEGYVKPLMHDLDIVDLSDDGKNPLKLAWEAVVAGVVQIFKNHPKDQLGTKVPITGTFDDPQTSTWATVVNLLRNGFVQALPSRVEDTIGPERIEQIAGGSNEPVTQKEKEQKEKKKK